MLKIASWNIEGRLDRYSKKGRGSPEHILRSIKELEADVIVLLEAHGKDYVIEPAIEDALKMLGYIVIDVPYEEGGETRDAAGVNNPYMSVLSKLPIESHAILRFGDLRNAIALNIKDPTTHRLIRVIGIHLDDRSEQLRQSQLTDLIPLINSSAVATIMLGDYNAMHGTTVKAKFIQSRVYRSLKQLVRVKDTRFLLDRISEMALGTILASLESETELRDADPFKRPTTTAKIRGQEYFPSIRLIDIDHMMTSDNILVQDFKIGSHDFGSDHRPISAYVSIIE